MSTYLKHLGMAILAVVSVALPAHEASAESTLEKILSAKKIRIAIDVANPPFGVLDKSGQPDGSDVAVARQLAKDLGAEIEFVQVPSTGRIPALLAGRADVTIASISVGEFMVWCGTSVSEPRVQSRIVPQLERSRDQLYRGGAPVEPR